jgi:hypothetical protein
MQASPTPFNSPAAKSWRDVLPVHPAAELFPLMSPDELRELANDIRKNALQAPVVLWSPGNPDEGAPIYLLDGRNRLDAMGAVKVICKGHSPSSDYKHWEILDARGCTLASSALGSRGLKIIRHAQVDPYTYVISVNIHRRHLTSDQKRELIAKLLKAAPEKSDRQIADQTKASPTTVGKIRKGLEDTGDVSKLDTRTDTKGREQPASKPRPPDHVQAADETKQASGGVDPQESADQTGTFGLSQNLLAFQSVWARCSERERERIREMISGDGPGPAIPKSQTAPPDIKPPDPRDPGPIPACLDRRPAP